MKLTKEEVILKLMNREKLVPSCLSSTSNIKYCYYDRCAGDSPFKIMCHNGKTYNMATEFTSTDWEVYKDSPEYWEPKDGYDAFWLNGFSVPKMSSIWQSTTDKEVVAQGNAFETREEAEREAKLRAAKYRVKKRIWELNGGEFIKYSPGSHNWSFSYSHFDSCNNITSSGMTRIKHYPSWQYLKSEELVKQLIAEMIDDLILIRSE